MIDIGDVLVIITIIYVKQIYNGKVSFSMKLSHSIRNSIFHSVPDFSHVPHVIQDHMITTMNNKMAAIHRIMKCVSKQLHTH